MIDPKNGPVENTRSAGRDRTWTRTNARLPLTLKNVRDLWSRTYNHLGKPDWSHILPYYADSIVFQDSIQRIEGKAGFTEMCGRLTRRCEQLNMDILDVQGDGSTIFLDWKMVMVFRKSPSTPVYGSTKLTIVDGMIVKQRDYYDLWGDIFNGIPGWRRIYRRFMRRFFG